MAFIRDGVFETAGYDSFNVWYFNGSRPAVGDQFNASVVIPKMIYERGPVDRAIKKITVVAVGTMGSLMKEWKNKIVNIEFIKDVYRSEGKKFMDRQCAVVVMIDGHLKMCFNHKPYIRGPKADGTIMYHDPADEFI